VALKQPFFDKVINVSLHRYAELDSVGRAESRTNVVQIFTPDSGRKPTIRVSGQFVSQDLIQQVELRVTNFRTDEPLDRYFYATIEAGYAGGKSTAFRGKIVNSYQEQPGPDSVTVFQILVGDPDTWLTSTLSITWQAGVALDVVLNDIAKALDMKVENYATADFTLPVAISHNGLAKELLPKLRRVFAARSADDVFTGIVIQPWNNRLVCFQADQGTTLVYELDYITHAMHNAAGFDIQAPWIPMLRPGDWVRIDPRFFRQDFGGAQVAHGNLFQVYLIAFDFCTTDANNSMTLKTIGAEA